jgi:hypothetical protein
MTEEIFSGLAQINVDNIPIRTYHEHVLSDEGRFLEAILDWTERKLVGPGAPGTVDGLEVKVERREAQRLALGAHGCLAVRGGYVIPASKGARWCPGASRRSTPSLGFARDWQTSDALRRENAATCPSFRGVANRTAQRAARSRRTRNPDVTAHNSSRFRVRA